MLKQRDRPGYSVVVPTSQTGLFNCVGEIMSRYEDRYKSAKSKQPRGGQAGLDFDELPELSAMLGGILSSDGKAFLAPPCSLTLWVEGGLIKFVLGAQDDEVKTWGTFPRLSEGLYGVEKALVDGNCETKKGSAKR